MLTAGYVYVLINSSLPDLLKIGKTQGSPEDRARQLSSTGLPTPFVVAYSKRFGDCGAAERYVHTLLEQQCYRVTANREFFKAPLTVAIDAVLTAQQHYAQTSEPDQDLASDSFTDFEGDDLQPEIREPWAAILEQAHAAYYGHGDEIEDELLGATLYEKAAKLGAPEAFLALGFHFRYSPKQTDIKRAVYWYREGARQGVQDCWGELGDLYRRELKEPENARKCLKKFLASRNWPEADLSRGAVVDSELRRWFLKLRDFLYLCEAAGENGIEETDLTVSSLVGCTERFALLPDSAQKLEFAKEISGIIHRFRQIIPDYHLSKLYKVTVLSTPFISNERAKMPSLWNRIWRSLTNKP
jgi:hypothetical protein